ncbi:formylmethanofuran dehydrogenase subunit E [Candidatus Bathyarchaeota archaeon]|nr:formylmethanofuran dehydrogenase subunit E [Candidatus Bathyarchaeota archaeon]
METKIEFDLKRLIEKAADFHGHLGPFLVIGVRMGQLAKTNLKHKTEGNKVLKVTARIPLLTPFSCVLDGIQIITNCTVGNQKLEMKNSQKEIVAIFKLQNMNSTLTVSVKTKVVEELLKKISQGISNEALAWEIASMPENQLFKIK